MTEYPNAELLLAGDFNARTKDYTDFIVDDDADYIFGEHTAYPADNFALPKKSKDADFSNPYGLSLIELCCTFNVHILNGRRFGDKEGHFTCFANNGTSVVDYMIASTTLFPKITHFKVDDFDISDHLPIFCKLTLYESQRNETVNDTQDNEIIAWEKYKWNPEKKDVFLAKFRDNFRIFQNNFENEDVSLVSLLPEFIHVLQKSAENMKYRTKQNKIVTSQPKWWDTECEQAKRIKNFLLRNFRQSNTIASLEEYLYQRKTFKSLVKSKKINLKRKNKQNLINSRNDPKQFWKKIKANRITSNNTSKIEPNVWYQYFKQLLCPENGAENINDNLLADVRQNNDPADLNCIITDEEVKQSIGHLHTNKSPGPDGIPAEFYNVPQNLLFHI